MLGTKNRPLHIARPESSFWQTWRSFSGISLILSLVALFISGHSTTLAVSALSEAREQTELARTQTEIAKSDAGAFAIISAWQILNTRAAGNSGKSSAIEVLVRFDQPLDGLNISCEAMGGVDQDYSPDCRFRTLLEDLSAPNARMQGASFDDVELDRANLSGSVLVFASFLRSDLRGANLAGANLRSADMDYTFLASANVTKANLYRASLSGAMLYAADFSEAELVEANLSKANVAGAIFRNADLAHADLSGVYFGRAELDSDASDFDFSQEEILTYDVGCCEDHDLPSADLFGANLSGAKFCGR